MCPWALCSLTSFSPCHNCGNGSGNLVNGVMPNENRYPAQMRKKQIAHASANVGIRCFTAVRIAPNPGRLRRKYQSNATPTLAGRNTMQENFESTIRPAAVPSQMECFRVGCSSQMHKARNVAERNAVSAMSVVAKPACASTVGSKEKNTTAIAAV